MTNTVWHYSTAVRIDSAGPPPRVTGVGLPLRFGVPLPRGRVTLPCKARLVSQRGEIVPVQLAP
jgi:hypothetical protein